MVARLSICLWIALVGAVHALPPGRSRPDEAQDVAADQVEQTGLIPADLAWLNHADYRWKHLQTEHFVLHHEQKIFAAKVARLGEQFYTAISADLPNLQDRISPARSHVFIIRDPRAWKRIVDGTDGLDPWAASFVRGNAMYLQELGTGTGQKMEMLAHEMTHLVFNRFLAVRLPLWLNEGLAEYYGEFAYKDARGMGQSKKAAFRPLRTWTPMDRLLAARAYPADPTEVNQFYVTGKYLTGYLLLRQPREKWDAFFARLLAGDDATAALLETYGWADAAALEKSFAQFAR